MDDLCNEAEIEQQQQQQQNPARAYRSKRQRPCDVCRQRKSACRIDTQPPCSICRQLGVRCTFNSPPTKRRTAVSAASSFLNPMLSMPPMASGEEAQGTMHEVMSNQVFNPMDVSMHPHAEDDTLIHDITWQDALDLNTDTGQFLSQPSPPVSTPTTARTLDQLDGFSAQYFGLSGESDPYLLRHFRFESEGDQRFFKVHFRQVAAESSDGSVIPAQFMISANELGDTIKPETSNPRNPVALRRDLDEMIPPEDGRRLVRLFVQFVFPSFPIISRSQLGISRRSSFPDPSTLVNMPCHLLAAIYAISIQFCHHDPILSVSNVYTKPPTDRLWRIVLDEIMREIHTPHLSVLQATLLYIQKPQSEKTSPMADTPFRWSFMGFAYSLATTLGLHIECKHWAIPAWEKRLRRRLWWAVFSESAWRSLLLGFSNPIHDEHWDVEDLDQQDFVLDDDDDIDTDGSNGATMAGVVEPVADFMCLTELSSIASDIYYAFYAVKATRRLANNFSASLATARPLRSRLIEWYGALPEHYKAQQEPSSENMSELDKISPAYLRLAYLTLELFIYRALLRPIGPMVCPPSSAESSTHGGQPSWFTRQDMQVDTQAIEAAVTGAENCARGILAFTASLRSVNFDSFWFSWCRVCFSTMSNFAVLLFVQSPSQEHAQECKRIIAAWMKTLRMHSQTFHQMRLGFLRLNVMHWVGLRKLTRMSVWAEAELDPIES